MTHAKPSKSAIKREVKALQELGEQLIALKDAELATIPLNEELLAAVRAAASMTAHGALRRQKQLIGKLMRTVDADPIRTALHRLGASARQMKRIFAAAERWRDRLTADGNASLSAFESETGHQDETLRKLLTDLDMTINERDEKSLRREVFRRVHAILVAQTEAR